MNQLFRLPALLVLALSLSSSAADPPPDARTALDRYYADHLKRPFLRVPGEPEPKPSPPPWATPLQQLASEKADDRRAAAAYLCELLALALADELSGKAPWRNTPFWGGGADVPARDLRNEVAEELAKAKPSAEVLPVLRWYLDNERADRSLGPVAEALGKLDGAAADSLRAELATKPHANAVVAAAALRQIATQKKALAPGVLAALSHHHRAAIRDAARVLNAQQGGKDPGPFDPAKAVRAEPVAKLMVRVLALIPDLPAAEAEFVTVTVRYLDDKKAERRKYDEQGWLVEKKAGAVKVFTPHGRVSAFPDGEKTTIYVPKQSPDGKSVSHTEVDVETEVTVTPVDPAELVKEVVLSRKKGSAGNDLSERGGLTGQFRGSGATLFEAILGGWLYRAGRDAEAAKILLPAIDSVYRDDHLALVIRDQVGELVGQRMLVAFVGDRDYLAALGHARQINELYQGTRFHRYAKGLAEQLPKRTDDFTKLRLPTPAEWAALKKKLARDEQIDFLCERMRLLNCFQMGQPGGYDPGETQYAEPCGLSENAAWGGRGGKTEVINPLTELTGYQGWRAGDGPKPKGMELMLKDVPRLSKYLRDDWYMHIVSFWRDFSPDRNLSSTRPQFASIINGLAHKDLCRIDDWSELTPAGIDQQIERINKWAAENAGKTPAQLEWGALEEDIAVGEWWPRIERRIEALLKAKEPRVYDLMRRTLEKAETGAETRGRILDLYRKYDVKRAKELALPYLTDADASLRLSAALVVFETGDKSKARQVLGDAAEDGYGWSVAAEALLGDDTPESRKELARLAGNGRLAEDRDGDRPKLLARCAAAGLKEPYAYYLKLLETGGNRLPILDKTGEGRECDSLHGPVAEVFAAEIVSEFAAGDAAVKDIAKRFPATKDQIPHLKQWLRSRLDRKD